MLSIKDCKFGCPKTWKKIVNYDSHVYKEERLISEDLNSENVTLIDNIDSFEKDVEQYKKDLFASYQKERHTNRKKSIKEINKEFYSSKLLRSFRISISHIELESLNKQNDNEFQRRKNTVDFYQSVLNQFQETLKKNNKWNREVKIVLVDIHFDQTSPHIHIHASNLRKTFLKKLNRESLTCNVNQTDLIRILKNEQSKLKNGIKANEIFANYLKQKENKLSLDLINKVNLKKLFTKIYDVQLYKLKNGIKDHDIENKLKKDGKLINSYKDLKWRIDKEILFQMHKQNLEKLNLKMSNDNDIYNSKKMDNLTLYCWKQSLAMQMIVDQKLLHKQKIQNNEISKDTKFELDLNKLNDNKYVNEMIDRSLKYPDELSMYIIQPHELKDISQECLLSNISKYCPDLKDIEQELHQSLGLFKNLSNDQILNNELFINNAQQQKYEYINISKLNFGTNLNSSNNNGNNNNDSLYSIDYAFAQEYKKSKKKKKLLNPNDYEEEYEELNYNVKK